MWRRGGLQPAAAAVTSSRRHVTAAGSEGCAVSTRTRPPARPPSGLLPPHVVTQLQLQLQVHAGEGVYNTLYMMYMYICSTVQCSAV